MESIFADERVLNYYKKRIKHKRYNIKNEIFLVINDIIETSKANYEIVLSEDEALAFFYMVQDEEEPEDITLQGEVVKIISKIKATLTKWLDFVKGVIKHG